ncbi:hypothetical protein HYG86_06375 [Alkalicella caledoniensis]|uniref:Uncharacterized protein n=1 Tax=Alkalicella caledoniensis TaxID=2731377 RepID=A0A7G9W6W0_ALKCA|nr:hypothetical protein [Alkalicella caledoniensis]QNO14422.1 hypothetical protein HYG86_06375 [Alkalicella caledoniensis]
MSYKVIKGAKQLEIDGKEIENNIYLPLEALWDDYTILKDHKVIFIDSPLNNLEVGLLQLNGEINSTFIEPLQNLLQGAGCRVHLLDSTEKVNKNINLVLVINSQEGVFQTGYGGYRLNGSKKIAADMGWALARFFELDYVAPPVKEQASSKNLGLWKKFTTPLVYIKFRTGEGHNSLLAISVLMGLFRFATKTLPVIDEKIFSPIPPPLESSEVSIVNKETLVEENLMDVAKEGNSLIEKNHTHDNDLFRYIKIEQDQGQDQDLDEERVNSDLKEVDFMSKKSSNNSQGKKGRLVTDPSPKLKAHMKKIIAKQKAEIEKENKAPNNKGTEYAAKLAGLGKG